MIKNISDNGVANSSVQPIDTPKFTKSLKVAQENLKPETQINSDTKNKELPDSRVNCETKREYKKTPAKIRSETFHLYNVSSVRTVCDNESRFLETKPRGSKTESKPFVFEFEEDL